MSLNDHTPGETERSLRKPSALNIVSGPFARVIQSVGAITSIVALILSVSLVILTVTSYLLVGGQNTVKNDEFWVALGALAVFCLIALAVSVFIAARLHSERNETLYETRQLLNLQRSVEEQDEIYRMLETLERNVSLDKRRVALRVRSLYTEGADSTLILQRILGNWRKFTDSYVDICRAIMETATGERCCCCVKLLNWADSEDSQPTVQTLMRDQRNRRNRSHTDTVWEKYPASSNSAYSFLLNDATFDRVYVCDDLRKNSAYLNSNSRWSDYYNSTIVAGIGSEHFQIRDDGHDTHLGYDMIGFLCFDSKKASFENERCVYLAKLLASYYNEYLNYIARTFFVLNEEQLKSLFEAVPESSRSSRLFDMLDKYRGRLRENRPLGIFLRREHEGPGSGVVLEKTPMIIQRMFLEWSNRSIP